MIVALRSTNEFSYLNRMNSDIAFVWQAQYLVVMRIVHIFFCMAGAVLKKLDDVADFLLHAFSMTLNM